MAINILTEPTDPPIAGDFTLDQAIQHAAETPQLSILTTWESTGAAPAAKQGAFIRHAGNTFQVQSSDEAISGSVTAGLNYIIATETAGVITLAWATTLTGYSYNPAYGGIYNAGGPQALKDICFLDGADYLRGMSFGEDFNYVRLANGNVIATGDATVTGDSNVSGYNSSGKGVKVASSLTGSKTEGQIYTWLAQFVTSTSGDILLHGTIAYNASTVAIYPCYATYRSSTQIDVIGGDPSTSRSITFASGGFITYSYIAIAL